MPDLLFEDQQATRVADLGALLAKPSEVNEATPLHRVTVFATYGCNLACPYCKTIARSEAELEARPAKRGVYDLPAFEGWLATLGDTPIEHLHFTGGEASLVKDLPHMVRAAKARNVTWVSITSNGTLPPERYLALVAAGTDEVRISIDANDAGLGERLTLRVGAWSRAVASIRALARAREQGQDFFLILNSVIGLHNRGRLFEIVRFLLELGPDDVKLITEVDERDHLAAFGEAPVQLARLQRLLRAYPEDAFPLLRRKLETVFAPDAIGLERVSPPADGFRCYIPLTERTVDATHYYPCSVYLREAGVPLGPLSDDPALQRRKLAAFVDRADCLEDPICRRYCLNCTREFNLRANEAR